MCGKFFRVLFFYEASLHLYFGFILSEFAIDINDGYATGVFTGKIDVIEPAPEPNSL